MNTRLLLPILALLPLAACDQPESGGDSGLVEPSLDGKSDEFSGVEDGGTLRFGETIDGTFDEDFQFFEYTFRAREDALLDIEVTRSGSSQGLDTTLFLYRNEPGAAPSRIAVDDDEGWGSLSRIRDFRLFSEGEYTIVVGTKNGSGRGNFRLSLGCADGDCEPQTVAECNPFLQEALEECFAEIGGVELDFEVPAHALVGECRDWVNASTESICPTQDEPLCVDSAPALAACEAAWEAQYVRPIVSLTEDNDGGLDALVESVWSSPNCDGGEDAGCRFEGVLYRYEGDAPGAPELLAFARETSEIGPGAYLDQTLEADVSALRGIVDRYGVDDAFEAFLDDAGLDLSEARVAVTESFGEFQWNWGDCEGGLITATFPSAQRVVIFEDSFCAG